MLELAERMGRSCTVYGLDPSDDAIRMITQKKELKGIGNARIIRGVAEEIPFPDEFFGLIVSNNGLNNVKDQAASLAECYRVADKGAQMVLTMNLPHTMTEFYDVFEETLQENGLIAEITAMHEHISLKRKPVEYLKKLIINSGFVISSIQLDGFKMKFCDGTAFFNHNLIRKAFMQAWKEILPADMRDPVFTVIEQKLNRIAGEKGELVISVPYACIDCLKP